MANRAYLYTATTDFKKLRDVSESKYPIPLVYKIVLGVDTELANSQIWTYEAPIAIQGDFAKGLQRLYNFFDYLETQSELDVAAIAKYKADSKAFFEKEQSRMLDLFFLEGGEIFDLIGDPSIEVQNVWLMDEILSISEDIEEVLTKRPANLFEFKKEGWFQDLRDDIQLLSPYWTHVTYFSFNKSGEE